MQRIVAAVLAASALLAPCAHAQPAPEVTLTRLDCGNGFNDQRRFSDTFAYSNPQVPFTFSCYVVRHGADVMVWDTGYLPGSNPNAPKVTLLIGEREWAGITSNPPMAGANVAGFTHWIRGGGKLEAQSGDKDVFGDGTVVILRTPGHTPGHQALLVRLKEKGPVILTGDAAHFHENYESDGVPGFNYNRAQTIASIDRIKEIEKNLHATVIIQHDPRDIGKLPAFPAAAR
jgi:hypothetical protein